MFQQLLSLSISLSRRAATSTKLNYLVLLGRGRAPSLLTSRDVKEINEAMSLKCVKNFGERPLIYKIDWDKWRTRKRNNINFVRGGEVKSD